MQLHAWLDPPEQKKNLQMLHCAYKPLLSGVKNKVAVKNYPKRNTSQKKTKDRRQKLKNVLIKWKTAKEESIVCV